MCPECYASCKRDLAVDKARSTVSTVQRQSHDQTNLPEDVATVRSNKMLAQLEIDDLDVILTDRLPWFGHVELSSGAITTTQATI